MESGVRNHNSVGVKRPYLHELSIDHLHYGVADTSLHSAPKAHAFLHSRASRALLPSIQED